MALVHALPAEPVDIRPLGAALRGTRTSALFKSGQLELMRVVLPTGAALPPHAVAGEITVQCLEGAAELTLDDGAVTLRAGQLLYLPGGCRHGVRALADCSLLVTIVLG